MAPGSGVPSGRPIHTATTWRAVEAERPGVAAAPARAGLPGDAARAELRQRAGQHIGHRSRGAGGQEVRTRLAGRSASRRSGPPVPSVASAAYSAAASRSVMPSPPRASGNDGSAPRGSRRVDAGGAQRGGEAQRANAVEQRHGRQVQRAAQRIRRGDAAGETAVEVLRRVATEAARQVGHDRVRRGDAVGEGHGVDERFQCRSRASARPWSGRARRRATWSRQAPAYSARISREACIGHQHGERGAVAAGLPGAPARGVPARPAAAGPAWCGPRGSAGQASRELRRVARQRDAGCRHGRAVRRRRTGRRGRRPPARGRARGRGGGVAVGAQAFGSAGDRHQQGGLRRFQRLGRHAEPGERAGADALQVAAERRERQPDVEHAAGGRNGASSCRARAISISLERKVRGRGSSRRAACMARVDPPDTTWPARTSWAVGAQQGERIDAGMMPEARWSSTAISRSVRSGGRRPRGTARRRRRRGEVPAGGPCGRGSRCRRWQGGRGRAGRRGRARRRGRRAGREGRSRKASTAPPPPLREGVGGRGPRQVAAPSSQPPPARGGGGLERVGAPVLTRPPRW